MWHSLLVKNPFKKFKIKRISLKFKIIPWDRSWWNVATTNHYLISLKVSWEALFPSIFNLFQFSHWKFQTWRYFWNFSTNKLHPPSLLVVTNWVKGEEISLSRFIEKAFFLFLHVEIKFLCAVSRCVKSKENVIEKVSLKLRECMSSIK